jgi:transcription initiation factor IIE alpha subunit
MQFNYKYSGSSNISSSSKELGISFAPDTFRKPTFFVGDLNKHLPFREAISALHDIVVSDLRHQPKDRSAYMNWLKEQELVWLAEYEQEKEDTKAKIDILKEKLHKIRENKNQILQPFYQARQKYYKYLQQRDYDLWYVLDPVITIHPDELFFECFSQDESSYGKLSCNYNVFKHISEYECGTTNIDYSATLYKEFQKIRTYKNTQFKIDPSGFEVATEGEADYKEVKIDLPESWVRGFLQVSSAMTLPATNFDLHPMDLYNFLFVLKNNKAKVSPRSMRFVLTPNHPIKVVFEPWNYTIKCPRSIYKGDKAQEIRIWGRRRLLTLERLIPIAKKIKVTLLGNGLPSFFMADLGDMTFTLGLSGWTANDWSKMGNFDLLTPRRKISTLAKKRVFEALQKRWFANTETLMKATNLKKSVVLAALQLLVQAGKVIYDLHLKVYRLRALSNEELPMRQLRFQNEQEEKASQLLENSEIKLSQHKNTANTLFIRGTIETNQNKNIVRLQIDADQKLVEANCTCRFFQKNKLLKGPCEHILAARIAKQ